MWVPLEGAYPAREDLEENRFRLIGRLRPRATTAQVEAEAESILGRPMRVALLGRGFSALRDILTRPLLLLGLVAGLVFVIMCANLASLILARTSARDRELAVRRAIGASRGRVVRQLVTESAVLASVGAVLGLAVAYWTSAALLSFLPPEYTRALPNLQFEPDAQVLGFIAALSLVICIACGLVPAVRATGGVSAAPLRAHTSSRRERSWMSRGLLVGEVAMCTLLLVVAGVFLRSLHNLVSQDAGYNERGLLVADVVGFPFEYTVERRDQLFEELRSRIAALPGVEAASFSHRGQLDGGGFMYPLRVPGREMDPADSQAEEARVTPGFLAAMGTPLVAGRDVSDGDHTKTQFVAVVNEAFIRHFRLAATAVGQRFQRTYASGRVDTLEIVGIAKDAKWASLREPPRPIYYVPYQQSSGRPNIRLAVRASGDLDALGRTIAQTARSIDYSLGIPDVVPFAEIVNRSLVIERLVAHVSSAFAAVGVLIACIGLYGLLAYSVVRRRREIGVRIAVGASPGSVEWMMLRESLALLIAGFAIGLPAGVLVVRLVSSMLFQLSPADPMAIAGALATLMVATVAATFVPARQAAGVDPIQVLRED
jgi:predicted permease